MKNLLRIPFLSPRTHATIFFALLCILAAAMPTSRYIMSLTQILMGANWLLEGGYREKTLRFIRNKPAIIFTLIFGIHVAGLLWSSDLEYALTDDLIDKLPLLTLTFLVVSSAPLPKMQVKLLLYVFFASVFVTSLIGFFIFITGSYSNFRQISPFIPHVYMSMMVVFTMFALPWHTYHITTRRKWFYAALSVSVWLLMYLFILRSLTGLLCLAGVSAFLLLRYVLDSGKTWIKVTSLLVLSLLFATWIYLPAKMYRNVSMDIPPDKEQLEEKTAEGNSYRHFTNNPLRENGYYVFYFVAEEELRKGWNAKSNLDFDGQDLAGNDLKSTLYRYLTSLGLKKDRQALQQLQPEDLRAIEEGIPNHLYNEWPGFMVRVHQTVWEVYWYRETGDPTNHTFTQRLELWKGSWTAFREKPLLGWGTGDVFIAVQYGLEQIESKMENYHMKPHNQYLLFLLTLGLLGSLAIYGFYVYYVKISGAYRFLPFNLFVVIMLVAMLGNNPIDAQAGQTFFTFFSLFYGYFYPFLFHGAERKH